MALAAVAVPLIPRFYFTFQTQAGIEHIALPGDQGTDPGNRIFYKQEGKRIKAGQVL